MEKQMKEILELDLSEKKKEEILANIKKHQTDRKDRIIKQRLIGEKERRRIKELRGYIHKHKIKFFGCQPLELEGYTVTVAYVDQIVIPNMKKPPVLEVSYVLSCCSPQDKYIRGRSEELAAIKLREGKGKTIPYHCTAIKETEKDVLIPELIVSDIMVMAQSGCTTIGTRIPQKVLDKINKNIKKMCHA